jgi:DNA-binding NarL/FixJ family response regulator
VGIYYKRVLETQAGFVVVGVAEDGLGAVKKASELAPDVVISDVLLPNLDGVGAALQILEQRPETAIVMISSYDDLKLVKDLIQREPRRKAFLLKDSLADIGDLIRAVAAVTNGQMVLDPNIVKKLTRHYVNRSLLDRLTTMERQVVMQLTAGAEDWAIAESLDIDPSEVAGFANSIYAKLPKLSDRSHLPPRDQAVLAFVHYSTSTPYELADEA